jgi:RNA polymerase sigma-70 factor (ECF subfamily)
MSFSKWDFDPYERDKISSKTSSIIQSQEDSSPSDTQLIIWAQAGNNVAFDLVCERYYNQIYIFQTRMVVNSWIGEELAQETFLKAWKAINTLRDPTKFLSWLYRIAAHEVFNYYRHPSVLSRGSYNQTLEELEEVSISGPEEQVEAQEHLKWALALVSPEKCRACLILYHIEGYSVTRIAEFLGIKQSSVRQYISSGLNQLKHLLEEDDTSKEAR